MATEGQYTTWRGDDPGFQTQAVGNYPDASTVADKDNIYLSEEGWAYRHYKNAEKTKYWDEIIWAGYVDRDNPDNLPVGIFGAEQQTFLTGDGFQFATGNYPLVVSTIGTVTITDGGTEISVGDADVFKAQNDGSFSGTKTYLWKVFQGTTDVTADTNKVTSVTGGTAQSATITFAAAGAYTVKCTVGDQAAAQASVTGAMELAVVAADTTHTIGTVAVTGPDTVKLNTTYQWVTTYTGNAPIADVDVALTATNSGSNSAFDAANTTVSKDADTNTIIVSSTFNQASTVGGTATVTATATDPTASDNGDASTSDSTTAVLKGVQGTVNNQMASSAGVTGDLPITVNLTSSLTGTIGTIGTSTITWDVSSINGDGSKPVIGDAAAANTTITFPAGTPAGTYRVTCEYSNANCDPVIAPAANLLNYVLSAS
jgi:hypothetical protein